MICFLVGYGNGIHVEEMNQASKAEDFEINVQWPQGKTEIVIPIEYIRDMPVISCRINQKSAKLLVDTGTQANCIYENRLEYFNLNIIGEGDITYTGSGPYKSTICGEHELDLLEQLKFEVHKARVLPKNAWWGVDGILGTGVMKPLHAVLDWRNNTLTFQVK